MNNSVVSQHAFLNTKSLGFVFLTGAEIFDYDKGNDSRNAITCMNPELIELIKHTKNKKIDQKTFLLSFEFKNSDTPLLDNSNFTKDHLEDMDPLFGHIDKILTEKNTY